MPTIAEAGAEFDRAMEDPENLVEIHRRRTGPGRRRQETTLNRAVVVLTVAAWQGYCQDLAHAGIERLEPAPGEPRGQWAILRAGTRRAINLFSTPNAGNARDLPSHVDTTHGQIGSGQLGARRWAHRR